MFGGEGEGAEEEEMREKELREHTYCSVCGKSIGHTGLPLFWTVSIEHHGIDMDAVRRQDGLMSLLGGSARLAQVMGTDAEMTKTILGPVVVTVCETCAVMEDSPCLVQLAEAMKEDDE